MEADPKAPVPHRREASRYGELPSQAETLDSIKLALYDIAIFKGGRMTKSRTQQHLSAVFKGDPLTTASADIHHRMSTNNLHAFPVDSQWKICHIAVSACSRRDHAFSLT